MKKNPIVSVIVPVYNIEAYLEQCVKSLCSQSYEELEILLIEDGSTDGSGKLCEVLGRQDPRITVIHQSHKGLSAARNRGIDRASGTYLAFVDGDDYLEEDAVERMVRLAMETDSEIVICNMMRVDASGSAWVYYQPADRPEVWDEEERYRSLEQPSVCNKLFRADLFQGIRFPIGKYYEDTYIYHELLYRASRVGLTGVVGYWYAVREGSISDCAPCTDRYLDFVDAIYERAVFLKGHGLEGYGRQACLSFSSAYAQALAVIPRTERNREAFAVLHREYEELYLWMMKHGSWIRKRQKLRLFVLRYVPACHRLLYGRRGK